MRLRGARASVTASKQSESWTGICHGPCIAHALKTNGICDAPAVANRLRFQVAAVGEVGSEAPLDLSSYRPSSGSSREADLPDLYKRTAFAR